MKPFIYEPTPGQDIQMACYIAVEIAKKDGREVLFDFNDVKMKAFPDTDPAALAQFFSDEFDRRQKAWFASAEYAERERKYKEEEAKKRATFEEHLTRSPASMTLKDPEGWKVHCAANKDGYGKAILDYAETWARIMEGQMAKGESLEAIAEECSRIADVDGLTGFMYGAAVASLSLAWVHGDQLRRWHNLKTQLKDEGEKANETGATLNPAMLTTK